ncbi:MAG: hypothetical protein AVDCRST_MAG04-1592, partial [uncultured Acetobacteraceae bacterium]
ATGPGADLAQRPGDPGAACPPAAARPGLAGCAGAGSARPGRTPPRRGPEPDAGRRSALRPARTHEGDRRPLWARAHALRRLGTERPRVRFL